MQLHPNNKYHTHPDLIEAHCLQMDLDIRADHQVRECEKQWWFVYLEFRYISIKTLDKRINELFDWVQ